MVDTLKALSKSDNGGSRFGSDRRQLTIIGYSPERRCGIERRSGVDRRKSDESRNGYAIERREIYRDCSHELYSIPKAYPAGHPPVI
jgi:hypothetical protein